MKSNLKRAWLAIAAVLGLIFMTVGGSTAATATQYINIGCSGVPGIANVDATNIDPAGSFTLTIAFDNDPTWQATGTGAGLNAAIFSQARGANSRYATVTLSNAAGVYDTWANFDRTACNWTPPTTQVAIPAAPSITDDPSVQGDAHYNLPADTTSLDWTLNSDGSVTVTTKPGYVFTDGTTTKSYPAPKDVYNPPAPPVTPTTPVTPPSEAPTTPPVTAPVAPVTTQTTATTSTATSRGTGANTGPDETPPSNGVRLALITLVVMGIGGVALRLRPRASRH